MIVVTFFENLEVFGGWLGKMQSISGAEGVQADRPEICEAARRQIDNVLGAENSSYTNTLSN